MRHGGLLALLAGACAVTAALAVSPRDAAPAEPGVRPAPPPAYCRARPAPAWPAFTDAAAPPDLTPFQDYRSGLRLDSARGAGVTIADIEYGWRATHAELASRGLPAGDQSGLPAAYRAEDHGTAVLGVLGGDDDGSGITGLAPAATLRPVSPLVPGQLYRPWETVTVVARSLGAGDVMLIELQAGLNDGAAPFVPIEVYPEMRAAIRAAVDKGIVVVEPAGNGGDDIARLLAGSDTPAPWLLGPAAPSHSGAIIVAGGGAGTDEPGTPDLRRVPGSNSGARVDLQGHGAGVVTSGYGDSPWSPSGDTAYTACFDGTSSAAATVAGAAAALQSAEIARDGTPLAPSRVRDMLVATGTPQADPADGNIGPRPSLAAAVAGLGDDVVPPPPAAIVPPPLPGAPVVPAAPPVPAAPAVSAASAASAASRTRPAARGLRATRDRRRGTLTLRFAGLAARAVVRIGGASSRPARARMLVRRARAGRLVVRVSAPRRGASAPQPVTYRVTIPARGPVRVVEVAR